MSRPINPVDEDDYYSDEEEEVAVNNDRDFFSDEGASDSSDLFGASSDEESEVPLIVSTRPSMNSSARPSMNASMNQSARQSSSQQPTMRESFAQQLISPQPTQPASSFGVRKLMSGQQSAPPGMIMSRMSEGGQMSPMQSQQPMSEGMRSEVMVPVSPRTASTVPVSRYEEDEEEEEPTYQTPQRQSFGTRPMTAQQSAQQKSLNERLMDTSQQMQAYPEYTTRPLVKAQPLGRAAIASVLEEDGDKLKLKVTKEREGVRMQRKDKCKREDGQVMCRTETDVKDVEYQSLNDELPVASRKSYTSPQMRSTNKTVSPFLRKLK
jgi:hypothetical protein